MSKEMDRFLQEMNKKFGDGSLKEFGDGIAQVETISTGIPSLDLATGVGGFPRGRIVELYGPEGVGKTTVALKAMAEAQRMTGKMPRMTYRGENIKPLTGRVGMLDVEHAFDPTLAQLHGVKMGKGSGFYFDQPTGGNEAMQKLEYMINSDLFDIITIDSVAGLVTLDEQKTDIGVQTMASTAQLMSTSLKKLVGTINRSRTVVIFINQIRDKPAVMFGSPETTTGGRALKFYSSMRLRVARKESILDGTKQVGHRMKIDIKKNKVSAPFEKAEVDLYYRSSEKKGKEAGFDTFSDLVIVAKDMGIVELAGSQYRYVDKETGEIHKANGLVAWKKYLIDNPSVMESIESEMLGDEIIDVKEQDE